MDHSLEDIKAAHFSTISANQENNNDAEDNGSGCLASDISSTDYASSLYSLSECGKVEEHFIPGHEITAEVVDVERMPRTHPFNPNLYTIKLKHCGYEWIIRRRFKHFLKLDAELFLLKIDPRRQHNTSLRGGREHLPSRHLPHRPDPLARTTNMEHRKRAIEKYLRIILRIKAYRNHKETLHFLEVSHLSFKSDLGDKGREGVVKKSSGGHRFPPGCCSCCAATLSCGSWTKRWLVVKDSFVAYINPNTKNVGGVILIDRDFTFKYGSKETKVRHGLVIRNEARELLVSCWTDRKANEWMRSLVNVMATSGALWIREQPYGSFAPVRQASYARWFVDGASYFEAVANAIDEATEEIFIADWWLSPELHLKRPVTQGNRWRLDHLLKRKAESGVKIYVLVYKEVEVALTINSAYTKAALMRLHSNIKVMRHPDHLPGSGVIYWAHHEKIVSVDQKVTFLGGLDLCFGRWDDHTHRLTDFGSAAPTMDKFWRVTQTEQEIGRMGQIGGILLTDAIDGGRTQTLSRQQIGDRVDGGTRLWFGKDYSNPIKRDFFAVDKPLEDSVNRETTPRMPWHDIGVVVYGAPARDAARHFILRWNATKREKVKQIGHFPYLLPKSYSSPHLNAPPQDTKATFVDSQILRSIGTWSGGIPTETSIMQAYLDTIHNAKHYIYIENQFFITSIMAENIRNEIGEALLMRIEKAHKEQSCFRVLVVMPLLPAFEGEIGTPTGTSIGAIIHWNYRSICRGRDSLLARLAEKVGDPSKYISFYSLRTHSEIYGKPITELVYVHSKMLIADDDTVIIGSANINDRSLLGRRDSELAVIVKDTEKVESTMNGCPYNAGKFAHSLRTTLFREHLGLQDSDKRIDDLVSTDFYEDIWMATAKRNTEIYEKIFHCLPTDEVKSLAELISYKNLVNQTPLPEMRSLLEDVNGHLVQHPLRFMENENLRPPVGTSEYLVSSEVFT